MPWTEGVLSLKANEALEAHRRVKIDTSATTANPAKIVYAGAGEDFVGITLGSAASGDMVSVMPNSHAGTFEVECKVGSAINVGTVLYGAASGKVSDTSSGTAQGVSLQVAGASNEHIEVAFWNVKATTAATVSIADSGNIITASTVEAALAEAFVNMLSIQAYIPISIYSLRKVTGMAPPNKAAVCGVLGSDTVPILGPKTGATAGCQVVKWAAAAVSAVAFQVALPPDLNADADLVLHGRVACTATATDIPSFTLASYFQETGAVVSDTFAASGATTTFAEITATIALADVPTGAQTLTGRLTPGTHASSGWSLSSLWLEYKKKVLTS